MKQITFLSIFILLTNILFAQEKGEIIVEFSAGTSFSNFLNSEAPYKINIFGSDIRPGYFPFSDLTKSPIYTNYETGIFKDLLLGITSGIHLEYFIKNNLSFMSGFKYEPKGINLNYSNVTDYTITGGVLTESYKLEINNEYITLPFLLRKYLFKEKNIFFSGGLYFAYLVSSRIDFLNQKTVSDESEILSYHSYWIDNAKDKKREYTNKLDFGLSLGTGYSKNISDKLVFKSELLFNFGLRKVDSKYNNDYSVTPAATITNINSVFVRSTNYYGLNSNSKSINMLITVGLGYRIGK